ncbi:hypothetical protein WR25_02362 [Diploscapter pachys]|uniref:Uncharacterized protein n=1 Tax=Diploscapter pachys TaxID=2018661 RepID=A0A2A2JZV1_9BILA|nr:hypothetical protein WR25_02362 [Diploscapter pachys]
MPHPGQQHQAGATDRRRRGVATAGGDHEVFFPMDDQGAATNPLQLLGTVGGVDDCADLPGGTEVARLATASLPGQLGILTQGRLVPLEGGADHAHDVHVVANAFLLAARRAAQQLQKGLERRLADAQGTRGGKDRCEGPDPLRITCREGLRDHAAHRHSHDMRCLQLQAVHQADDVVGHVGQVIAGGALAQELLQGRGGRHVGEERPARVTVVQRDDLQPLLDQPGDQRLRPVGKLQPEADDEQDRRGTLDTVAAIAELAFAR